MVNKKGVFFIILYTALALSAFPDNEKNKDDSHNQVKNVIILIPDGCSPAVLALTRLYYSSMDKDPWLSFDSIISGFARTITYNSVIGESAANITALMTGHKSQAGYLGLDGNGKSFPSVFELAKAKNVATGVVGTCEFPNATTTASMVHTQNRSDYNYIVEQLVKYGPDIIFAGGGSGYLNSEFGKSDPVKNTWRKDGQNLEDTLRSKGCQLIFTKKDFDDISETQFRKVWCLFNAAEHYLPYDFDRPDSIPSLAGMTKKAINILSKKDGGFLLLVEGSKIDWAAHNNDPVRVLSEFTAFDQAVAVALEFARQDQNTAVIITPDHGNGGIAIGNVNTNKNYSKLSLEEFGYPLFRKGIFTGEKLRDELIALVAPVKAKGEKISFSLWPSEEKEKVIKYITGVYGIMIDESDAGLLVKSVEKSRGDFAEIFASIFNKYCKVGWTTTGHSGEDVFLAVYHPGGYNLKGVVDNTDIARYIAELLGLEMQ